MRFSDWLAAVDDQLKRRYAINSSEAGFDDAFLKQEWRSGETPNNFVERIALKFDLEPATRGYFQSP